MTILFKKNKNKLKFKQAFTIIELMITMIILSITAAIATPVYSSYVQKAKINEAMRYAKSMQNAYATYYALNGTTPNTLNDMGLTSATSTTTISSIQYIPSIDPDDGSISYPLGALRININPGSINSSFVGCDLNYRFIPTINNNIMEWSCQKPASYLSGSSCGNFIDKISPSNCN
jgi:prepilin-type N-terminal cleavage/methylation domain-containing protein